MMQQPAPYINVHSHHVQAPNDEQIVLYSRLLQERFASQVADDVYFTAGVHPWHAAAYDHRKLHDQLEASLKHQRFLAVGEIGLDKAKGPNLKIQQTVFIQQLEWAQKQKLPVIIHNVKADGELMSLRKQYNQTPWILHGFQGNGQQAAHWLAKGCYVSIGVSLFGKSSKLMEVIPSIPVEWLFVETDEAAVDEIVPLYNKIATLKELSLGQLRQALYNNMRKVFIDDK